VKDTLIGRSSTVFTGNTRMQGARKPCGQKRDRYFRNLMKTGGKAVRIKHIAKREGSDGHLSIRNA
jgi:hypothetical protein